MKGKVAIITAFDPFVFKGGIETYTIQLLGLLREHRIACDVYHTGMVCENHSFYNDYLGRLYSMGKKVLEKDREYDFIIANSFYGLGYFPPKIKTYNIYHLTHKGFAESIKGVIPEPQYLEWKLLWGHFSESISGFNRIKIAVSESVRDELKKYYGFGDVGVVANGIDTGTFLKLDKSQSRRKWGIPENSFVGLCVGRLNTMKGCNFLVEVMSLTPDVYWVVVLGTGAERNSIPVRKNVRIIEQIPYEKMPELYSAADFMLFLSLYEGFGYVIIEAMACELPVITTNVGIAKTIYKNDPFKTLLLPSPSDGVDNVIQSSLTKINYLMSDKRLCENIGEAGRKLIEKEYSIDIWKDKMSEILGLK